MDNNGSSVRDSYKSSIVSDPTNLTTQQLRREIELLEEKINIRFLESEKAVKLLQELANKSPSLAEVASSVNHLQEWYGEKFAGIETQFQERDKRTEQLSLASSTAIAAALQAQKEAAGAQNESNAASITKSESAFTKQIDQMGTLLQAISKGVEDKINDLKSRMDKGEGHGTGTGDSWVKFVSIVGIVISLATVVILIISKLP